MKVAPFLINDKSKIAKPAVEKKEEHSRPSIRARRTRLQAALLEKVPRDVIKYGKKLVAMQDDGDAGKVHLTFHDGTRVSTDLVVGSDGIRSVGISYWEVGLELICMMIL